MNTKSEVLKRFLHLLEQKYSGQTPLNYHSQVKKFLNFADKPPLRVTNEDILNYNLHIRHLSESSRNIAINAIKGYFKLILRRDVKEFASIRPKKTKRIPRHIEHNLLVKAINNTINLKAKLILMLGYGFGLRSSEVINLKMYDIDIEQRFMIISGKGYKQRKLPLYDEIIATIIYYVEEYNPQEYLFNGRDNKGNFSPRYSRGSILKLVKKNIGDYRFHDLRHSYAMTLYKNGVSLDKIQKLLGHADRRTTDIYAYATDNILMGVKSPIQMNY